MERMLILMLTNVEKDFYFDTTKGTVKGTYKLNITELAKTDLEIHHNSGLKIKKLTFNGEDVDPNASYRIVSIDYVIQGNDRMEAFKAKTNVNSPQEERNNLRYIIMDYFREQMQQGKVVDREIEGRIIVE